MSRFVDWLLLDGGDLGWADFARLWIIVAVVGVAGCAALVGLYAVCQGVAILAET